MFDKDVKTLCFNLHHIQRPEISGGSTFSDAEIDQRFQVVTIWSLLCNTPHQSLI